MVRPARSRPPAPGLAVAAVVLGLEALGLLALAALHLAQIRASSSIAAAGVAFVCCALFLLVVARGVFRGRRWSRAPAVATQLIQLPIAWTLREGAVGWVAGGLAISAVVTLIGLLVPSSTAVFAPQRSRSASAQPED